MSLVCFKFVSAKRINMKIKCFIVPLALKSNRWLENLNNRLVVQSMYWKREHQ